MEYSQLFVALALGRKIILTPFVLSYLYQGYVDLVIREFDPAGGPSGSYSSGLISIFLNIDLCLVIHRFSNF